MNPIDPNAVVSYDSILHVCELCGDEVGREFFGELTVVHMKWVGAEQPPVSMAVSLVWKFLDEATTDSALLATLEQFEDQATNRLLIAVLGDMKTQA